MGVIRIGGFRVMKEDTADLLQIPKNSKLIE
jgi:hypothetical protein